MGRYTYLPIRYYHDTWVPIRYVLWFFFKKFLRISILQVLRFDIDVLRFFYFFFNSIPWEKVEWYTDCHNKKKKHILAVTIAIRYYN